MATLVCVFKILCVFVDDAADQYHPADAYEGAPIIEVCPDDRTALAQQAINCESETQRHFASDVHGLSAYPGYGEKPLVFASDMDRSDCAVGGISISSIPEVATTRSAISSVSPLNVFLTNLPRVVRD
jgi:hypothetical protein